MRFAITLAEELSFSRAAERHFISAQPFGRAIQELEREAGLKIFVRTTRKVQTTLEGQHFLARARQLLSDVDGLMAEVKSEADGKAGRLVLGVFGLGLGHRCPDVMRAFRAARPDVTVEFRELGFSDMDRALQNHEVDVSIVHFSGQVNGVISVPLFDLPRGLVVPIDSEWAGMEEVGMAELTSIQLLGLPYASKSQAEWAAVDIRPHNKGGIRTPSSIPTAVATTGQPSLHAVAGAEFYPHPSVRYVPCTGAPLTTAIAHRETEQRPAVADLVRVTCALTRMAVA